MVAVKPFFAALGFLALVPQEGQEAPPAPHVLERVVVIGASASAGFMLPHGLSDALEATIVREHEPIASSPNTLFFLNPLVYGPKEIAEALEAEPTLVVAVDFLFWFGYGLTNAEGKPLGSEEERLALLEEGLALIAVLDCPVIVGDFPDCSHAIGTMLFEPQVPSPESLAALNARLTAWAKDRPNVILLPFASLVASILETRTRVSGTLGKGKTLRLKIPKAGAGVTLGDWKYEPGAYELLMQPDDLHPTIEGLAVIAHFVARSLVERGLAPATEFDLDRESVLQKLGVAPAGEHDENPETTPR